MGPFLAGIRVIGGPLPVVLEVLAAVAALALIVRPLPRGACVRWLVVVVGSLVLGASVGLLACWLIGDVANAFDVTLSTVSRAWVAVGFAGIALAIASLIRTRARRRVGAVAAALLFALVGAVGVNADFGQYPTLASALGLASIADLPADVLAAQKAATGTTDASTWQAPADLPAKGLVGAVTIPATVSHFAAREGLVYLPPAALTANPPALPVLVMLSGQPGSPEHVFISGHVDKLMDAFAAQNHGLAPIVVVPDQLSAPSVNPMCVDSAIGNSATYLTVDVPAWIRAHLHVETTPSTWAIGGFSQGGTCAIQLGAGHPDLFGSIFDVSGELEPKVGSEEATIAAGFAGSASAYDAAKPLALIAAHAPYSDTVAVFAAGALDTKYSPWIATVAAAASAAGMHSTVLSSPGTAHDWYTVQYAITHGFPPILAHMGLTR